MYKNFKAYWWILLTYVIVQFSGFIGMPIMVSFFDYESKYGEDLAHSMIISHWSIFSFSVGLLIILFLLRNEMIEWKRTDYRTKAIPSYILWSIGGFFLALFSQSLAALLEMYLFKIEPGSENTADLVALAKMSPAFIVITCLIGPILEELVFRKAIFSTFHQRFNFIISALLSSLIFAIVHFDFDHLLVYTAMGFVFSFLYVRTKTILVPIIVHASMNSYVMFIQLNYDKFKPLIENQDGLSSFIFWN